MQADGGSYVCLMPGFYPGYEAYTPYMPFSMIGVDGQYVGQQVFSPMFQSSIPSPEYSATSIPHGDLVQAPYLWGSSLLIGDGALENGYVGVLGIPDSKPIFPSSPISPAFPQSKSSKNSGSTNVSSDVFAGQNKKLKPLNKVMFNLSVSSAPSLLLKVFADIFNNILGPVSCLNAPVGFTCSRLLCRCEISNL